MFLALIGVFLLTYISQSIQDEVILRKTELKEKQQVVEELDDHLMFMFFHARGYYLLKSANELEAVHREKEKLEKTILQYELLPLNEEEKLFLYELKNFLTYYNNELFPQAVIYVENNNYEALRSVGASGATAKVLTFLAETEEFSNKIEHNVERLNEQIFESANIIKWFYVVYIFIILFVLGVVMYKIGKSVGQPLIELTVASEQIVNGTVGQLTQVNREDELGILSRAFQEMHRSIQVKEEELMAQNEELIAQQETLEYQQNNLENSLLELKNLNIALNKSAIVAITDDKGVITHVNEKFTKISRYSEAELIGQDHRIINSGFHSKEFFKQLWKTILSGEIWIGEIKNKAKDGSFYWVETTIVPYLDHNNKPYQFIAIRIDITDIKLAEEKLKVAYDDTENRRKLNQDIIDHVNDGITFLDKNGVLIEYNQKINKMLDVDIKDLKNSQFKEWTKLFNGRMQEYLSFLEFLRKAIFTEYEGVLTYRYEMNGSTKKVFDVYAVTIKRQGVRLGTLVVHRDITAEYEVDQMKSELVSTVSHELRTPLSSVLGFTELMLTKELKKERQKKYLETIHKEAFRLTNLINDFLDIQRMESGKQTYEKQNVNIVSVVKEVLNTFKSTNKQHKFIMNAEIDNVVVYGDEQKFIQLFVNLVSNAIKFSPQGGNIQIRFKKMDSNVVISIEDEGLGIPPEEVSNLFQKFYRIDNSDRRKIGGTGLGLAICKQIVVAHNGDIWVSSTLGKGSIFYVKLPVTSEPHRQELDHIHQKDNNKPTLVIVEDDESLGMLLVDQLKDLDLNVNHYSEGELAFEAIQASPPKLIVLDIMLEGSMDGWAVIDKVKKCKHTENVPIIISSALDEKEKGMALGVDHYLTKPYPPSKLSEVVLELLLKGRKTGEILVPVSEEKEVE